MPLGVNPNYEGNDRMGILKIFSGKDPEEYEQKGDSFFDTTKYGLAKIEYETALNKLEKTFTEQHRS